MKKQSKPKEIVIEEAINKMHAVDRKRDILCKQDEQTAPYMQQYVPSFGGVMPDYSKKARQDYIKKMQNKEPRFLRTLLYIVGSLMIIGMLVQIFM